MEYYAHKYRDKRQTVKEHLKNTAFLAESNALSFMKSMAYAAGLLHDIGKYSKAFQERLNGSSKKYEHSSCGAIEIYNFAKDREAAVQMIGFMLEYCIAGHHTGLPDGGNKRDMLNPEENPTLYARLGRSENYVNKSDYSDYKKEINLDIPECKELLSLICSTDNKTEFIERYAFFTRYLFSCLTDADFLDTERFCNEDTDLTLCSDMISAEHTLNDKLEHMKADTDLQKARARLQRQAYSGIDINDEISILNMPTGSGKTLCSLNAAFKMISASGGKLKRIIYVIPYTSIIEQTAEVFSGIFGNRTAILQHHSNYDFEPSEQETPDDNTEQKLKKAAENWDAPVIITTSVQFFESLYHYKSSRLRKLHNIADSVIVFDEIHLLPTELLQPCLRAVGYITKYLGSRAVFLSATMPNYNELFQKYIPDCIVKQLITDITDFSYFKKCTYTDLGMTDYESIAVKASAYKQVLIVVNTKKAARELYCMLPGNKYHLSTYMTPFDRSRIIDSIKKDLLAEKSVTVVSTSLIEAGVDLDFETVFRELSGLDNILQAGGRCNREGKRESGAVCVFRTDTNIKGERQNCMQVTSDLLKTYDDITSPECVEEYYRRIFKLSEKRTDENTIAQNCIGDYRNIPFRTYAESFKMIKEESVGIVIGGQGEADELIERLKNGDHSVKRKLQKYTVSLKMREFSEAVSRGVINDFGTGVFILTELRCYDTNTGLDIGHNDDIVC